MNDDNLNELIEYAKQTGVYGIIAQELAHYAPQAVTTVSAPSTPITVAANGNITMPVKSNVYVIAGNYDQFRNYRREKVEAGSIDVYIYLDDPIQLRGISNPHGVLIGTWKERADIKELLQELIICSHNHNHTLKTILESL